MYDTIANKSLSERLKAAENRIDYLVDDSIGQRHRNMFVMAILRRLWDKDAESTLLRAIDKTFDDLESDENFEVHMRAEILLNRRTRAFKEKYAARARRKVRIGRRHKATSEGIAVL